MLISRCTFAATPEAGPCAIELNLLVHRIKRIYPCAMPPNSNLSTRRKISAPSRTLLRHRSRAFSDGTAHLTELGIGQPPGHLESHLFKSQQFRKARTFLWVSTKQQSRLEYSQSLMSISLKPDAPSAVSKTESPHGLLSDRLPAEVDPPCGEVFIILTDYDCGHAYHLREVSRARTHDP